MATFDIDMSSPVRSGWRGGLGGPNSGGHKPPKWYIQYGNDLQVPPTTKIFSAFSGYVRKFVPHVKANDKVSEYGAQLFVRSNNNKVGVFYTHFTRGPNFSVGQQIKMGDFLGETIGTHVHFAIAEIIGGHPGDVPDVNYMGVDLYNTFLALRDSSDVISVRFEQNHTSQPTASLAP